MGCVQQLYQYCKAFVNGAIGPRLIALSSRPSRRRNPVRLLTCSVMFLPAALAIACASARQRSPEITTTAAITTADLERRLRIIADDSMMGRESGSQGDFKT